MGKVRTSLQETRVNSTKLSKMWGIGIERGKMNIKAKTQ